MPFATPSLRRTRRCQTRSVARATTTFIGFVCTSGSKTVGGIRARYAGMRLTIWGQIRRGGGRSRSELGIDYGCWPLGSHSPLPWPEYYQCTSALPILLPVLHIWPTISTSCCDLVLFLLSQLHLPAAQTPQTVFTTRTHPVIGTYLKQVATARHKFQTKLANRRIMDA